MKTCDKVCPSNPCRNTLCPAHQNAECRCDSCKAIFVDYGDVVDCKHRIDLTNIKLTPSNIEGNRFCTVRQPEGFQSDSNLRIVPVGTKLEYKITCKKGFKQIGKSIMTCLSHENWDSVFPYCQRKIVKVI